MLKLFKDNVRNEQNAPISKINGLLARLRASRDKLNAEKSLKWGFDFKQNQVIEGPRQICENSSNLPIHWQAVENSVCSTDVNGLIKIR